MPMSLLGITSVNPLPRVFMAPLLGALYKVFMAPLLGVLYNPILGWYMAPLLGAMVWQ